MGGLYAVVTEVARCLDKPGAEVALPDAIHHDASGEGILRAGDPVGERGTARLLGRLLVQLQVAEGADHGGKNLVLRLLRVTAEQEVDFVRRAKLPGKHQLARLGVSDLSR